MKIVAQYGEEIVLQCGDYKFIACFTDDLTPKLLVRSDVWRPPGEWKPLDAEDASIPGYIQLCLSKRR